MRPETAISLALLWLHHKGPEGTRADVARAVERLRAAGVDVTDFQVEPTPTGVYSEQVSEFVGRLIITGFVTQESPIRLRDEGIGLLRRHLLEARAGDEGAEVSKAASVFGLSLEQ